jgi:hypothetical protein
MFRSNWPIGALILGAMLFVLAIVNTGCAGTLKAIETVKPVSKCVPAYAAAIACTYEVLTTAPPPSP